MNRRDAPGESQPGKLSDDELIVIEELSAILAV
jgi:hypothetical protein